MKKSGSGYAKSEVTKEFIRRTALKLIDKYGYEKMTIQDICKASKVSIGTFYYYFESKESLMTYVSQEDDILFETKIKEALNTKDPEEFIRKFFEYYAEININIGTELYYRIYGQKNKDINYERRRPMYMVLETFLVEAKGKGLIRKDVYPFEIVNQLFVIVRGVVIDWCINDGRYDLKAAVENILNPLISYYVIK